MKKVYSLLCAIALTYGVNAQALKTPQPSTTQKLTQDFGIGSIDLTYSRPNMNGRKVFGDLVPYGKLWRTGANGPTRIKFSNSVEIAGKKLAAGEYSLFTIPNADSWTIVFNADSKLGNVFDYKQSEDSLRVEVKPATMFPVVKVKKGKMMVETPAATLETFTMQFANVKSSSCELHIMWENTAVAIPITVNFDADVMKQINTLFNKDTKPYYAAANYYMENNKDLNQALEWYKKAAEMRPDGYWIQMNMAKCLEKLGKTDDGLMAAQKCLELAQKADNQDYVKLANDFIAKYKK
jgi:hypothetical protein